MKTCPNPKCKATGLPDDARFCPNCGTTLQKEEPIKRMTISECRLVPNVIKKGEQCRLVWRGENVSSIIVDDKPYQIYEEIILRPNQSHTYNITFVDSRGYVNGKVIRDQLNVTVRNHRISPETMPTEVEIDDEFLLCNNWRYTFFYLVNGRYQRYSGKISNTERGKTPFFTMNCNEGYIYYLTIFHSNGNIAVHWKLGKYLQYPWDNEKVIEHEEYYSEIGKPLNRDTFSTIYADMFDNFGAKLEEKMVDDTRLKSSTL